MPSHTVYDGQASTGAGLGRDATPRPRSCSLASVLTKNNPTRQHSETFPIHFLRSRRPLRPKPHSSRFVLQSTDQFPTDAEYFTKTAGFANMSSTLDELLQDFEDSGSEAGGDEYGDGLLDDGAVAAGGSGVDDAHVPLNDEDVDEGTGDGEDEDEAMGGVGADDSNAVEDPEEAKAKVEKMHLGGVRDVRTVATLMKSLKPVLEVSPLLPLRGPPFEHGKAFTSLFEQ